MKEEEIKALNIYEKMILITDEIGVIEKNLKIDINKTRSYKAVSERDVLDNVKPLEKKYRVYSYPVEREIVDKDTLEKETDYGITKSLFMRVKTKYRFVNIDNPEDYVETIVWGDGIDTGDKAPGKAMTYADKYALMKAYKLSTGDDPDKDASPEKGYTKSEPSDRLKLMVEYKKLINETNTDEDKVRENYKVEKIDDMTDKQFQDAIKIMKSKLGDKKC